MPVRNVVAILLACLGGHASATREVWAKPLAGWVSDGKRLCTFDENARDVSCVQYHRIIEHRTKGGALWHEYRWMWKGPNGLEVHYTARIGMLGVSDFTIGELRDSKSSLPGHASNSAVSYSPSRDELVIGVPGEGYQFSVRGGST